MSATQKPRVLFLNRSYWPDIEATGQLLTALCEGLAEQFEVHVLAGLPNVADTNEQWDASIERNGVTIHRVRHTTLSKRNMVLKGINFLSFIMACRRRILNLPTPDIVVFETDPFLLPFVADRLRRRTDCRMIGYLQDIYPDVAIALKKVSNNWMIRWLRKAMFGIYHRCDRMVVLSSDMRNLLLNDGISEKNVMVVPNWADTDNVYAVNSDNVFIREHELENKFVAMYSGNLGLTQRLEDFVDAAALLQDDPKIQFVFVGRGARRKNLEQQVTSLGLSNVLFLDYQPADQLAHSLSAADLHLVPLTKELSQCLMPSKLYGILAASRAYLTNAPSGSELHDLTISERIGLVVEANSPQKIANLIRSASQDRESLRKMGRRGRRLAETKYSRSASVAAFGHVLASLLPPKCDSFDACFKSSP